MARSSQIVWVLFKTLIFTICVPGIVGVWIPYRIRETFGEAPDIIELLSPLRSYLSTFLICLGVVVYLWCAWDFSVKGLGTPAPIDAPKKLIVNGLYQHVRNPMYLGIACLIIGQGLAFQTAAMLYYLLLFLVAASLFVMLYEEPHLRKLFGEQYEEYRRNVPRWVPRLKPYRPPAI